MPSRTTLLQMASTMPDTVRGGLWMTAAALLFAALNALVRLGAEDLHPMQLAFFRCFFGLVFMLPWLVRVGPSALRTRRHGMFALRGVASAVTMLCWFTAVAMIPLADAVAVSFTAPLLTVAAAAVLLGEQVGWRRWSAIAIGFLGMLIIVRPGSGVMGVGALYAIAAATGIAAATIIVKLLSKTEDTNAIVTYMVVYLTPVTFIPAVFVWQWPPAHLWPLLVGMGLLGTVGHICVTRAIAATEASVIMPLDYLRLPFAAAIGLVMFSERPDMWTWIGAAVIIGSSAYVARREALLRKANAARVLEAGRS